MVSAASASTSGLRSAEPTRRLRQPSAPTLFPHIDATKVTIWLSIALAVGLAATTVAPWQLFFQQSNVIDKRITTRFMGYERADTFLGSVVVVVGAGAIMIIATYAVAGTPLAGHFTDALGVADALGRKSSVLGRCLWVWCRVRVRPAAGRGRWAGARLRSGRG